MEAATAREPEPANITMVTYNRLDFTRRSISSIADTAGYPYELTVVDNGSRDGTVAYSPGARERRHVHRLILNSDNMGVAYAANQGWAAGPKCHYMKIDNDIVFTRQGWLAAIVGACDALPDIGAIAYNFETTSYPQEVVAGLRVRPKRATSAVPA